MVIKCVKFIYDTYYPDVVSASRFLISKSLRYRRNPAPVQGPNGDYRGTGFKITHTRSRSARNHALRHIFNRETVYVDQRHGLPSFFDPQHTYTPDMQ